MEKYITFSVPAKKEVNNDTGSDGKKKKTITYKLKFIDSFRFMPTSLSKLIDITSGIFNSIECKSSIEKIKINSECCFVGLKNNRLIYKCKEYKEEWKRPLNKLTENFPSIYETSNIRKKKKTIKPNYHSCKKFSDRLMAIEMKKARVKMNKPLYLGMSILDISETLMYNFW